MSAALQLPLVWAMRSRSSSLPPSQIASAVHHIQKQLPKEETPAQTEPEQEPAPSWAFYRKHTERLLRRYLYASMQVGRTPNILEASIGQGWVSSRPVRTFEDALIFVLDVERCLKRLSTLDRQLISRVVIQEYTFAETAALVGISLRAVNIKLPQALDRLTESLVKADLLVP